MTYTPTSKVLTLMAAVAVARTRCMLNCVNRAKSGELTFQRNRSRFFATRDIAYRDTGSESICSSTAK